MSVLVAVIVVVVVMIMPAAAPFAMGMRMGMGMGIPVGVSVSLRMRMGMGMISGVIVPVILRLGVGVVVIVGMAVVMVPAVMAAIVIVGAALGLEGAHHRGYGAALAASHLGEDVVLLDIQCVRRDLGRAVPVAHMVGHLQKAQGVLGPDFQKPLGRRLHLHEASILELHGVPVVQHRGLLEVEEEIEPSLTGQGNPASIPALVVERDGVGDVVCLHSGFPDDSCGAEHGCHRNLPQNRK